MWEWRSSDVEAAEEIKGHDHNSKILTYTQVGIDPSTVASEGTAALAGQGFLAENRILTISLP